MFMIVDTNFDQDYIHMFSHMEVSYSRVLMKLFSIHIFFFNLTSLYIFGVYFSILQIK